MRRVIALTTDFGSADGFPAAMKGVILGISPDALVVDVSHDVPPQACRAGGVLVCEFPIDLQTGDVLLIAEIEADGAEGWQALVAESGGSAYTEVGDAVDGFAELALP